MGNSPLSYTDPSGLTRKCDGTPADTDGPCDIFSLGWLNPANWFHHHPKFKASQKQRPDGAYCIADCEQSDDAPNKPGLFTCAAGFANKYSIAGGLNALGIGSHGGVGGFLTNALGGNAFSGLTSAVTSGVSVADVAFSGTYMGFGGTTAVQKGIAGVATDAAVGGAWSSVTGAGQTIQTLSGASSLASTGIDAAEFASGVGLVKLGYDGLSYLAGIAHCAN